MVYRKLLATYIVSLLLFGIPLLVVPATFMKLFGVDLSPGGRAMSSFYGASMLGVAWMMWKAMRAEKSELLDGLMNGNLIIWGLSFVIASIGQIRSTFNLLGLTVVILSVCLSGWYGYIRYKRRER